MSPEDQEMRDKRERKRKREAAVRRRRRERVGEVLSPGEMSTYPGRGALKCGICGKSTNTHPIFGGHDEVLQTQRRS